jgi:DNA-binding response OmpR family regulator
MLGSDQGQDSFDFERLSQLGLDRYRITLIAPEGNPGRRATRSEDSAVAQLLVLPLTWEQLRAQTYRRIANAEPPPNIAHFGDVHVDFDSMEVRRSGHAVNLTTMEFKVLKFFVLNPRRVISPDALLHQVWGYNRYPYTRTVDNHIVRLRQKLEPNLAEPFHFRTVHGMGYKFILQ